MLAIKIAAKRCSYSLCLLKKLSVEHSFSYSTGGDSQLFGIMKWEKSCSNVEVESRLERLFEKFFALRTSISGNFVISASGFWRGRIGKAIFDVRLFNLRSKSNSGTLSVKCVLEARKVQRKNAMGNVSEKFYIDHSHLLKFRARMVCGNLLPRSTKDLLRWSVRRKKN